MDPDVALFQLRRLSRELQAECADAAAIDPTNAEEMVEYFEALDGWLTKGGFLPKEWRNGRE
jgi:hypothetical protein